jgi:sensor domain CHASE-containing protein
MVHNEVMTHNMPEEKSPAKTAEIPQSQWQEDLLPDAVRSHSGWSLITALLLGTGIIFG